MSRPISTSTPPRGCRSALTHCTAGALGALVAWSTTHDRVWVRVGALLCGGGATLWDGCMVEPGRLGARRGRVPVPHSTAPITLGGRPRGAPSGGGRDGPWADSELGGRGVPIIAGEEHAPPPPSWGVRPRLAWQHLWCLPFFSAIPALVMSAVWRAAQGSPHPHSSPAPNHWLAPPPTELAAPMLPEIFQRTSHTMQGQHARQERPPPPSDEH